VFTAKNRQGVFFTIVMSGIPINIFGWRKRLLHLNPIVFNYQELLALLTPDYAKPNPPQICLVIASLMNALGFYYAEVMEEENPETRRFPEDDPYTIAECWAYAKGYERCLRQLVNKISNHRAELRFDKVMNEIFVWDKEEII
jgi:hypothetical protein